MNSKVWRKSGAHSPDILWSAPKAIVKSNHDISAQKGVTELFFKLNSQKLQGVKKEKY